MEIIDEKKSKKLLVYSELQVNTFFFIFIIFII